jgi:hypothetical protein
MAYDRDAARARRLFKELDRDAEPRQWELAELLHRMVEGSSRRQVAADVGRSSRTITTYVRVWDEHGAEDLAKRPSFADAYALAFEPADRRQAIETVAAETGHSASTVATRMRERVREVQEALQDPEVARAVAQDPTALQNVEEAGIEVRASLPITTRGGGGGGGGYGGTRETARDSAQARERGFGSDLALTELRNAATALGEAIVAKEKYGVEDKGEEAAIVDRLRRYLDAYSANHGLDNEDQAWLAEHGIAL